MRLPTIAGGKLRNALLLPVKDGLGEGATSGASGRIGLLGRWTIVSDNGQVWQPYVCAYLWRDWGARATAIFSGVDLVALLEQANRLQLGGGVSVRVNTNVSLYANADYQRLRRAREGTGHFGDGPGEVGIRVRGLESGVGDLLFDAASERRAGMQ